MMHDSMSMQLGVCGSCAGGQQAVLPLHNAPGACMELLPVTAAVPVHLRSVQVLAVIRAALR